MFTTRVHTATLRRLSVEADADPRTVAREIREPMSVRGMTGDRIRRVLARHGLPVLSTDQASPRGAA